MKTEILNIEASAFAALAHPLRLKILEKLRQGACCVCKIIPYVGVAQSNVSHHLAILRKAGIVKCDKRGLEVWYEVINPEIFRVIDQMDECIMRNLDKSRDLLRTLERIKT